MLRRWRAAWPRRSRRFEPPWPQVISAAPPSVYDQSGPRPRFAPKLRRGHFHEPAWPQGSSATPTPAVHHAAGPRPLRFPALPRRGHSFEPPWPQVPGANPPPRSIGHGYRPNSTVKARRGTYFPAPPSSAPSWPPQYLRSRRPAVRAVHRSTYLAVPTAAPPSWTPGFRCSRRPTAALTRHPGRHAAAPPIWTPPGPTRVIDVTGVRAVVRWSATEGRPSWIARSVVRWSGREGGTR